MKSSVRAALVVVITILAASATLLGVSGALAQPRPTVVLVHGAFADTTSWDGVAKRLRGDGYRVVVPVNPLRGPISDAAAVGKVVSSIRGPVVLVGHSYGGAVITNVHSSNVRDLVYIAAFAPAQGEPVQLMLDPIRFPGSQLIPPVLALKVVNDSNGVAGRNLDGYVEPADFHRVFAPDVDNATAARMIAHQRSIAVWANLQPSGPTSWSKVPSWYAVSTQDRVIPPAAQRFMAQRIHAHTIAIPASHASLVSQPAAVTALIERAAG